MEGFTVGDGVIHTEHGVALALVAPLGGGHEQAAADRQVLVVQQVGEELFAIADGFVRLVHDAEVEGELRGARGLGERLAALIGGEHDGEAAVFTFQPGSDFLGIGEAWHTEILTQDGGVIALDAAGGFVAADADPLDGLFVRHGFAQPDFERLADEREARHCDDDAAGFQFSGDPIRSEALAAAAGHDEFPALGFADDEMGLTVLHRALLVRSGFQRFDRGRLVPEMSAQSFQEIRIQCLPNIERAKADALLILEHMGDALGGRANDAEGKPLADSEGETGEGG